MEEERATSPPPRSAEKRSLLPLISRVASARTRSPERLDAARTRPPASPQEQDARPELPSASATASMQHPVVGPDRHDEAPALTPRAVASSASPRPAEGQPPLSPKIVLPKSGINRAKSGLAAVVSQAEDDSVVRTQNAEQIKYDLTAKLELRLKAAEAQHQFRAAERIHEQLVYWSKLDPHGSTDDVELLFAEKRRTEEEQKQEVAERQAARDAREEQIQMLEDREKKHAQTLESLHEEYSDAIAKHNYRLAEKIHQNISELQSMDSTMDEPASCCVLLCRIDLLDEQLPNGAESGIANQLKSGGSKASIYSVLTELSRGEVTGYRHAFTKCAKLQDWMDLKEFGQLMELLNELGGVEETIAVHELKQMFGKMAVDDVVSFHDFLIQMYEVRLNVNLYELHRLGFDTIDCARDSDKHISAKDLVAFVNKTEAARLRAGQEFVLADALVGFNEESAEKMVREAESFFDHELVDVFDFQLNFDEYFKAISECKRGGAKTFPETHNLWRALGERLVLSQAVGLLRQDAAMGYHTADNLGLIDDIDNATWMIFMPNSVFTYIWDTVSVILLIYITVLMPVRMGFGMKDDALLFAIDIFMEIFFLVNVGKTFLTAYRDETGKIVTSARMISRRYIRGDFLFDVIVSLPFLLVEEMIGKEEHAGEESGESVTKLLRVFRILRLARIVTLVNKLRSSVASNPEISVQFAWALQVLASARLIISILLMGHLGGCAWYAAGASTMYKDDATHPMHAEGWVALRGWMISRVSNGTEVPWTFDHESSDYLFTRYMSAVFDALSDMVIEKAQTDSELVVGLILHIMYEVIYGFMLGTLTTIVMESRASKKDFEDKMNSVIEFASVNKLDMDTQKRICTFISKKHPHGRIMIDEAEFLSELPPSLRTVVVSQMYSEVVSTVPIFKHFERETRDEICAALLPIMYTAGDNIVKEGTKSDAMYFIIEGSCKVTVGGTTLGQLAPGSFFGDIAVESIHHATRSVWAAEDCTLRYLAASAFDPSSEHALKLSPLEFESIRASLKRHTMKRSSMDLQRLQKNLVRTKDLMTSYGKESIAVCTVYVGGLGPDYTQEMIKEYFGQYGNVIQVSLRERQGQSNWAMITFETRSQADTVKSLKKIELDGMTLRLTDIDVVKALNSTGAFAQIWKTVTMKVQYALEQPQNAIFCDDLYAFEFVPHSLFVANMPPELASEVAIRACLNDFGHCIQASVRKKEGDASYALVSMASKQSVDALVTKDGRAQLFIEKSDKYITINRLDMHRALASTGSFHQLWKEALRKAEKFVYPKPRPTSSRWRAAFEKLRKSKWELGRTSVFASVAMDVVTGTNSQTKTFAHDSIFQSVSPEKMTGQGVQNPQDVHAPSDNHGTSRTQLEVDERDGASNANITHVLKSMHDQLQQSLQRQLSEHEQRVREILSQLVKDGAT